MFTELYLVTNIFYHSMSDFETDNHLWQEKFLIFSSVLEIWLKDILHFYKKFVFVSDTCCTAVLCHRLVPKECFPGFHTLLITTKCEQ